jgi:hypothetical protein
LRDGHAVRLLAPEGRGHAQHEGGFGGSEVGAEVVVVDSLPGFVGGAPGGVSLLVLSTFEGKCGWVRGCK